MGNLLYLDEELNGALDNKSFTQKKAILEKSRRLYDVDDVLDCADWGPTEIQARSARLASAALAGPWSAVTA